MIARIKYHWAFLVIFFSGLLLRFISAFSHSYSNDELSAINRLRFDTVADLLEFGVMKGDMHPAGVQFFMKGWSMVFGQSEMVMRFPFIIAGGISLFLIYKIGLLWFNKNTAIIATGLMAFLCFPIIQNELARPYSIGLMGALMVTYMSHQLLFEKNAGWKHVIGLGISLSICMYSHYFALLFAGLLCVIGILFVKHHTFFKYSIGCAIGLVLFLPHLPITIYHLSVGGLAWLAPPENDWLFDFLYFAFNASVFLSVLVLSLGAVGLVVYIRKKAFSKGMLYCGLAFFGIYLLGHFLSYAVTPLLKFPVMIFALPFLLFMIGNLIGTLKFQRVIVPVFLITTLTSTIYEKELLEESHYATLKPMARQIEKWQDEFKNQKIALFVNVNNPNYLNFYTTSKLEFERTVFDYGQENEFRELLKNTGTFYCVFGFAARNTPIQFFETALEFYPGIVDGFHGYNNAVYLLHKQDSKIKQKERILTQYNSRTSIGQWNFYESNKVKDVYLMDEFDPYGPDCFIPVSEIQDNEYVKISVVGTSSIDSAQITIGVNVYRDGELLERNGEIFWMGYDIDQQLNEAGAGYFAITIPPFVHDEDSLKISLLNRGEDPFYLNSIGVTAKENIWNYFIP